MKEECQQYYNKNNIFVKPNVNARVVTYHNTTWYLQGKIILKVNKVLITTTASHV